MRLCVMAGCAVLLLGVRSFAAAQESMVMPRDTAAQGATPSGAATQGAAPSGITFASVPWTVEFSAKDFALMIEDTESDERPYLLAENQKTNVTLSIYLEKATGKATEDECEQSEKRRLDDKVKFDRDMIVMRKWAGMEILEYTIPQFDGAPVQQRNLYACLAKDNVYVDVHISKILFKPQDEKLFSDALDSIHFVAKAAQAGK